MSGAPHTPLPWKLDVWSKPGEGLVHPASDRCRIIFGPRGQSIAFVNVWADNEAVGEVNGEYIVRAVNSHAELLSALEAAMQDWHAEGPNTHKNCKDTICTQARAAIAAAREPEATS